MTPYLTMVSSDWKFSERTGDVWYYPSSAKIWIEMWLQGSTCLLDEYNHYID